ncbi:TadE/TadG family type IV pilus assembly protein, partial [Roseinatronobacter sp.]|uniref:TadE/TadG family type IV pilus assembly protein n=1 Tax=Roseinatronobacter sp. TaxID=1945755 RepID=UPI0025E8B0A3
MIVYYHRLIGCVILGFQDLRTRGRTSPAIYWIDKEWSEMLRIKMQKAFSAMRFWRSEGGAMLIFGLFVFIIILLVSGLAVDFMRYENNRVRVQATADRATLAAATLRETGDRKALVEDYFEKAGLSAYLHSVDVEEALNAASVTVRTTPGVNTLFMRWAGVDQLSSAEISSAREEVTNIEIVMVLDISGSMRWTDSIGIPRITRLRGAARNFVSTVL